MKRYGYLIEKIVEESNLLEAFSRVRRGKKRSRTVRYFKKNRDKILADLADEIKSGKYAPEGFREFEVEENGKVREIQSLPFKDRIALHAIMAGFFKGGFGGVVYDDSRHVCQPAETWYPRRFVQASKGVKRPFEYAVLPET